MARKRFEFEFDDTSPDYLEWDYEDVDDDRLVVEVYQGQPILYVNRDAARLLAQAFARIALGDFQSGFHVHIHEDFDADKPDALILAVSDFSTHT